MRVAANKAKMLSLGLPGLALKVGGSCAPETPTSFAPVKRKQPERAEYKPTPFRIVLRQRVAKVNYADCVDGEENKKRGSGSRGALDNNNVTRQKFPRFGLATPSSYSALLGTRRPAFQPPPNRRGDPAALGGRFDAAGERSNGCGASDVHGSAPETLDDKYSTDPEAAKRAKEMGVGPDTTRPAPARTSFSGVSESSTRRRQRRGLPPARRLSTARCKRRRARAHHHTVHSCAQLFAHQSEDTFSFVRSSHHSRHARDPDRRRCFTPTPKGGSSAARRVGWRRADVAWPSEASVPPSTRSTPPLARVVGNPPLTPTSAPRG